jgi:Flp pilus assembly protein TadD
MRLHHLIELEQKALALQKSGRLPEAVEHLVAIVSERPDWEHGTAFYALACCYEDLGQLELAEQSYANALRYQPKNPIFLGGFASFLYLHRDPTRAFNAHLALLEIENANRNQNGIDTAVKALKALGSKIGLSNQIVANEIKKIVPSLNF